jgi:ABC-2 type transport system permease protein
LSVHARSPELAGSQTRHPRLVVAGHVFRIALRGALIWGTVFGLYVVATVEAFMKGYPTVAQRLELAHSLQAFTILLGVPRHAETVSGFTTWRVLTAATLIGAIWGLLTSTSLLRGEEDAGRWELLLAGPTTPRRATAQALVGLGAAFAVMFALTALLVVVAGRLPGARFSTGGSILFATILVSGAGMFLALGAVASQLASTRSQAATLTAGTLGLSFVVRMIADSSTSLGWLRWFTPIGWVEEAHPFASPQPLALAPIAGLIAASAVFCIYLAGRRDLNASVLPASERARGDTWWLGGTTMLAARLTAPVALGWLVGTAGFGVMLGSIARASVGLLTASPAITAALGRFGVRMATLGYLSFAIFFVAVIIAMLAASQIGGIRGEEAEGRLDNLLVRPVGRTAWLTARLAIALALVFLVGIAATFFTWVGAATHHTYVALPTMLEAGLNSIVPSVFVIGAGTLVFGVRPRFSSVAAYGIVTWSFLVDLLGSFVKGMDWLRDSSVFTHVKLAPATKPDWGADALIVLIALVAAVVGAYFFGRRDLEYG